MKNIQTDDEAQDPDTVKLRKAPANARPTEGHVLIVDGKFKTPFETVEAALSAGVSLKSRYPVVRVQIYDAAARSYAPVELTEGAAKLGSE